MFFRPMFVIGEPSGIQLAALRFVVEQFAPRPDRGTDVESTVENGVRCAWVTADGAGRDGVVLYLHGGGYFVGSAQAAAGTAARISAASGLRVCVPDYRLLPEHPVPAAADDAVAVYRALLAAGVDPATLVVAGDSAGGHLAACLVNDVKDSGLPLPRAVVLWSPVIDPLGQAAIAADRRRRDAVLAVPFWAPALRKHLTDAPEAARMNPLADVDHRWPPTLIQVGGDECLLDDAHSLADALALARVPHRLQVWDGQVHVFQYLAGLVPEARRAIEQTGRFIREAVTSGLDDVNSGGRGGR